MDTTVERNINLIEDYFKEKEDTKESIKPIKPSDEYYLNKLHKSSIISTDEIKEKVNKKAMKQFIRNLKADAKKISLIKEQADIARETQESKAKQADLEKKKRQKELEKILKIQANEKMY